MTQVTERGELLSSASALERGRAAALTASFLRGSIAACLGLGALSVLVMALWISSPYPDSGAGGALHVAVALWLLAHGVDLVRPGTLSGAPAPVGIVPLLLVALPGYLAYRAARDALEPQEGRPQLTALGAVATVTGGYLLVAAGAVAYEQSGAFTAAPLRAAALVPAFVVAATAAGAWTATGRPAVPLPRWLPYAVWSWCARTFWSVSARRLTGLALRAGAASTAVLLGGGALFVAVSLVLHGQAVEASFLRLSMVWSGRLAVLFLALTLVPNAAVWGAAYGLGPGFALSTTATVTPFAAGGDAGLPSFPLLAAVPQGAGGWPHWSAAAVPVAAGVTLCWFTLRKAAPAYVDRHDAWSARGTVLAAALGAVVVGALTALLAAFAGGPLGTEGLARFGPLWWTTGLAALVWTVAVSVPYALVVRAWRLRGSDSARHAAEFETPTPVVRAGTATPDADPQDAPDALDAPDTPGRWASLLRLLTPRTSFEDIGAAEHAEGTEEAEEAEEAKRAGGAERPETATGAAEAGQAGQAGGASEPGEAGAGRTRELGVAGSAEDPGEAKEAGVAKGAEGTPEPADAAAGARAEQLTDAAPERPAQSAPSLQPGPAGRTTGPTGSASAAPPDVVSGAAAPHGQVPGAGRGRAWRRPGTWLRRTARPSSDVAPERAGTEDYDFLAADSWHERGAREARLAGLKEVSGSLMAGFSADDVAPWSRQSPPDRQQRHEPEGTPSENPVPEAKTEAVVVTETATPVGPPDLSPKGTRVGRGADDAKTAKGSNGDVTSDSNGDLTSDSTGARNSTSNNTRNGTSTSTSASNGTGNKSPVSGPDPEPEPDPEPAREPDS